MYHQLELEEIYWYITPFPMHAGLHHNMRLLFGVNAAFDIFLKAILDLLRNLAGVKNIADDIIVHGKNQELHDKNKPKSN